MILWVFFLLDSYILPDPYLFLLSVMLMLLYSSYPDFLILNIPRTEPKPCEFKGEIAV